jgi:chaperonin cofactor prefoldin
MNKQELKDIQKQLKAYKKLRTDIFKLPSIVFVNHPKEIITQEIEEDKKTINLDIKEFVGVNGTINGKLKFG